MMGTLSVASAALLSFVHGSSSGAASASQAASAASAASAAVVEEYQDFRRRFSRSDEDSVGFDARLRLYQMRKAQVEAQNAKPNKSWIAGLNRFADYTESEWRAMLGYRRHAAWEPAGGASDGPRMGSFLEVRPSYREMDGDSGLEKTYSKTVDWRRQLPKSFGTGFVRQQGACGSCWAVAAVGSIEALMERSGLHPQKLSYEQLVDCTPNPMHCGGTGACKGATGELAMQEVQRHGVVQDYLYKGYQSGGDGTCDRSKNHQGFTIDGFVRLPTNKLQPMLEALSNSGPAVVSVDASLWSNYFSGVFGDCSRDAIVNHAVLAVGYGHDPETKKNYWLIRNSWGPEWGEQGYIRLERHDTDQGEAGWCGNDNNPQEGVGCDGGPKSIPVCGMCGVLSDTSYPQGIRFNSDYKGVARGDAKGAAKGGASADSMLGEMRASTRARRSVASRSAPSFAGADADDDDDDEEEDGASLLETEDVERAGL